MPRAPLTAPALLLLLIGGAAQADDVREPVAIDGPVPFTTAQLEVAFASRLVPAPECNDGPLLLRSTGPGEIALHCGQRILRVRIGRLRGASAARVVALAAADLTRPPVATVADPPSEDAEPPSSDAEPRDHRSTPQRHRLDATGATTTMHASTTPAPARSARRPRFAVYSYVRNPLVSAPIGAPVEEGESTTANGARTVIGASAELSTHLAGRWHAMGALGYAASLDALERVHMLPFRATVAYELGAVQLRASLRAAPYFAEQWSGQHTPPGIAWAVGAGGWYELPLRSAGLQPMVGVGADRALGSRGGGRAVPTQLHPDGPTLVFWAGGGARW